MQVSEKTDDFLKLSKRKKLLKKQFCFFKLLRESLQVKYLSIVIYSMNLFLKNMNYYIFTFYFLHNMRSFCGSWVIKHIIENKTCSLNEKSEKWDYEW